MGEVPCHGIHPIGATAPRAVAAAATLPCFSPPHDAVQVAPPMRTTCYRCFWPTTLCWCSSIVPMSVRTKFVFLMHPKEYKQEKAATGRLTHLCLAESEIVVGVGCDEHPRVQELLRDPQFAPVLLYPGPQALNLSTASPEQLAGWHPALASGRRLLVFLLDATWALGRKMLRLSPALQQLPRIMFTPSAPSRYVIKQQPHPACLSTLEATHELLLALEHAGLDRYPHREQLLSLFQRMQDFQLRCAADPDRVGYRHRAYRPPAERKPAIGQSGARRRKMFKLPELPPVAAPLPSAAPPGPAASRAESVPASAPSSAPAPGLA